MDDGFNEFLDFYKKGRTRPDFTNMSSKMLGLYNVNIRKKIASLPVINNVRQEVTCCLDLLNAIYEFRACPDKDEFVRRRPDLACQMKHIDNLWGVLSRHTPEEMYIMVSDMFRDIDELLGGNY